MIIIFVYKITNKFNDKVYIGQSVRPIEQRFRRHINDALNFVIDTHFARAIRKYGKDNFKIDLIDTATTQDELNAKEQYWIKYYKSTNSTYGYNETDAIYKCGGNTYISKTDTEMRDISNKIRKSKIGKLNPNSHSIKCFNINTSEELFFDTVKDCKNYFNEKTHRFITTRVSGDISGLYKNEWKIAYAGNDYKDFYPQRTRKRDRLTPV